MKHSKPDTCVFRFNETLQRINKNGSPRYGQLFVEVYAAARSNSGNGLSKHDTIDASRVDHKCSCGHHADSVGSEI